MINRRIAMAAACALIFMVQPGHAGPCSDDIARIQAQVDDRIDAIAGAGPSAPETRAARLHREPTPGTMAAAEQKLGEGGPAEAALAALARARAADAAGDRAACEQALGQARQAIAR
ncbi:hypothetical protein [Microvirga lenta]|uniref:hypothetical protein n=1 Tax=Microvirga lenta TaxID=2881337 RepID=UPI001CFFC967|nr:hypothetical protein [Microvirga lenta]MCB5176971.1 hypothetical protein [Microvirga lenta]